MSTLKTTQSLYEEVDKENQTGVAVDQEYATSRAGDDRNQAIFAESTPTISEQGNGSVVGQDIAPQKIRTVMGGLTFQFADELEAYARSLIDDDLDYATVKAEINKKVADYAKENPKEAIGLELAGAAVPTVISLFGGPPAWSASVANIFRLGRTVFQSGNTTSKTSTAMTMAKSGTGAGVYAVGESDDKSLGDFGMGFIIGAPIAGSFVLGGNVVSGISTYVMHTAKRVFGGTTTELTIRKELNKLMKESGKTADEVIVDLMNGKLMSENQTMVALIRETVKGKGKAPDILKSIHLGKKAEGDIDAIVSRPAQTRRDVIDAMQSDTTATRVDDNLIKVWNADQAVIKQKESELYNLVFKNKGGNPNLVKGNDNGMLMDMLEAAQMKGSGVFEALEQIYGSSKSLVPLFTRNKNGVVRMLRQPKLEDVEVVRRTLSETAFEFNKAGKGQVGGNLQILAESLRNKLDNYGAVGASLKAVRQQASDVRRGREAYDYGKGILTNKEMNSAEAVEAWLDTEIRGVMNRDVPGVMNALRIGVTQALKNQKDSKGLRDIADMDGRLQQIMRQLLPKDKVDDTMDLIDTASDASKIAPQYSGNYNSQSIEKAQAANIAGRNSEGGLQLNPGAIFSMVTNYIRRDGGLSPEQAEEYARLVTTNPENYKILEDAIVKDSSMGLFNKLLDSMITGASQVGGDVVAKEGASEINQTFDPVGSSGIEGLLGMVTSRMGM
tara:strand:+ start:1059 stop:3239 length:2181 start_codon:yes stop_codon:yes gene_type:complete